MPEVKRLGAIRVAVGVLFLVRTTPLLHLMPGLIHNHGGPLYGWPAPDRLHVALFGLALPDTIVEALVVVRTVAALLFAAGVRARAAGLVAAAAGYLVWAQEPFSFIFTLHALYLATAILALTDACAFHALRPAPVRSPSTSLALVRAFVVSIYAWGALAKLTTRWLDGTVLALLREGGLTSGPLARLFLSSPGGLRFAAIATLAGEIAVAVLLAVPRRHTRTAGVVLACILHASFEITVHPDVFGWLMVILLAAFWPAAPARST